MVTYDSNDRLEKFALMGMGMIKREPEVWSEGVQGMIENARLREETGVRKRETKTKAGTHAQRI